MGIINAGTAVGAVAAPPLIAIVLSVASWRWVFLIAGVIGFLWAVWWREDYHSPAHGQAEIPERPLRWLSLLALPQVWGLVLAKFLSDAAWYFYLFWLPKYLYDVRGFDVKQVGYFAWIPYAASGIGCLAGGWFSGWLLRRGHGLNLAEKQSLAPASR